MKLWILKLKRNPALLIGGFILIFFTLTALFAPWIAPFDPNKRCDIPYLTPSLKHFLGTNDIGQDIFSEMVYGTRISLLIGIASALCSTALGVSLGMLGGYFGGWLDKGICALINIMMSMPELPLTLALIAFLGGGTQNMIVIISLTSWVGSARIIRSRVQQIREEPFIKIEFALGASHFRILVFHLLPNLSDIILTRFALSVGNGMTVESSLSFLGLGNYGQNSWGNVLHYAFYNGALMNGYYWWYLPPIICISLCMMGFMLISKSGYSREGLSQKMRRKTNYVRT